MSGGYSNFYPLSEQGCVYVCVRTDWGIVALKNAQCFLYLRVGLDGLAGRRERIDIIGVERWEREKLLKKKTGQMLAFRELKTQIQNREIS